MVTEKKKSPSSSVHNGENTLRRTKKEQINVSSKNAQEYLGPQSQELTICIGPELQKNDDTESDEGSADKNEETEDVGEFETTDSSFDALEKCIEWLSFHPTDYSSNAHHNNHHLQEVTKKKLVQYRQKAVQQWIDTLPDSSASSFGGSVKEVEDKDANGNVPTVPSLRPTSLRISGGSALERKPSLTRLVTAAPVTTESVKADWIERFPLIGRCCQRLSYLMGRFQIYENSRAPATSDEGKAKLEHVEYEQAIIDSMISEMFPSEELSSGEAGPRTSQDVRREANFRRTIDRNYAEEIQRLTTLLSNAPKSKSRTRTIFSLRKERILPEAQSAPGVIHRMGRHVQEFFSSRLNRNRNRANRVNPSSQENEMTATASQNPTETAKRSTFASIKNFFFSPNRTSTSEQFQ